MAWTDSFRGPLLLKILQSVLPIERDENVIVVSILKSSIPPRVARGSKILAVTLVKLARRDGARHRTFL